MGSLSTFRVSKTVIDWKHVTFTHRLFELQMEYVWLDNDSEVRAFFAALSSARELKELKLISIIFDLNLINSTVPLEIVSLPKLEFLYLERGFLNVLNFILSHIARGSYYFTLNLHASTARKYPLQVEGDDVDLLHAFLASVSIDKLILQGHVDSSWTFPAGLRHILQSKPSLKTLVLNDFIVEPDLLMALKQHPTSASPIDIDIFPRLTQLELHNASLAPSLAALKPEFETEFESHRIQTMVLGGRLRLAPGVDGTPLDEDDEVLGWMRHDVPQFSLSGEPKRTPEARDDWQLWNI
ncbi:hypothetical protein RSOL_424750, partial [Rhizoctonia solani AG-3 Rhs1AP]